METINHNSIIEVSIKNLVNSDFNAMNLASDIESLCETIDLVTDNVINNSNKIVDVLENNKLSDKDKKEISYSIIEDMFKIQTLAKVIKNMIPFDKFDNIDTFVSHYREIENNADIIQIKKAS